MLSIVQQATEMLMKLLEWQAGDSALNYRQDQVLSLVPVSLPIRTGNDLTEPYTCGNWHSTSHNGPLY